MKKFGLIIEYGTGKTVMETDTPDIFLALTKFYEELKKSLPFEKYKDFSLPTVISCELLPINQDTYTEGKKFALIVQYKYGRSIMITSAFQIDKAVQVFIDEKRKNLPEDEKNNVLINVSGFELLPVLYESVYERN